MKMRKDGVVTLVGDHRQLPPTISNVEVDVEGLGTSLFERLSSHGVEPFMLDIQYSALELEDLYRNAPPPIASSPSVASYGGRLRSGISGRQRVAPQGIAWPALLQSALAWNDLSPTEIGVITPYAAQARLIRRRLGCPAPGKRAPEGAVGVALVEVSSVDGFQGREKEREMGDEGRGEEKRGEWREMERRRED
eukprot:Skav215721  [mRNA]  locus=scaffold2573:675476:678116:- [translate_table: standard]